MNWPWETPTPGIYFNMPFEQYLSIPCLNASGIKELNISETDFWTRSWLNPDNDSVDEDTRAKIEGRAYHKRILEGLEAFNAHYALEYEDDASIQILRGNDEMRAALTEKGLKGLSGKSAESLDYLCQIYIPEKNTLHRLKKEHREQAGERELISPKIYRHIEFTAKMIELHPDTREYFKGGYPEVTVIFDMLGVRFKIRLDYIKVWSASDLKTFANITRAELSKAVRKAFASNKYHVQGSLYLLGLDMAKRHAVNGNVYGFEEVESNQERREKWLKLFAESPCQDFKYAFVQKGVAPAAVPMSFSRKDKAYDMGCELIRNGVDRFKNAYSTQGNGYWITSIREETVHYDEMPPWINDV